MNSRRIAYRKVRCPGEQPAYAKCLQAGEECVYLPAQRPTKANLNETIEALQKRLNETENMILKMRAYSSYADATPTRWSYNFDWPAMSDFSTLAPPNLSAEPPATPLGVANGFFASERNGSTDSRAGEPMDFDRAPADLSFQLGFPSTGNDKGHEQGQAACQEAGHGSLSSPRGTSTFTPPSSRDADARSGTGSTDDVTGSAVVDALGAYCSAVIRRECEVVGIANIVADYIAWMRKLPATGAPPVTNTMYQQMMANIETRVRELVEVAQKRHDEPLRNLLLALENASSTAVAGRVANLEADLQKQRRDHTNFFEKQYDTCKFLSEQAQKLP
ncbi:uncharacterized protein P884DRAFT_283541 [Thermothelomyces heterothallicus CBS 202.75]|uniref:uncharacterized protein n=1 Tax=Thermothelomyces heterothallicus CBS 202.75 TaxID=1149848 RepID=UPI003742317F